MTYTFGARKCCCPTSPIINQIFSIIDVYEITFSPQYQMLDVNLKTLFATNVQNVTADFKGFNTNAQENVRLVVGRFLLYIISDLYH
jgi:hypothetical protein